MDQMKDTKEDLRIAFKATESDEHFLKVLSEEENIIKSITKKELDSIFNPQNQLSASNQIINNVVKRAQKMEIF
jgi:adenylosuccinate lyase